GDAGLRLDAGRDRDGLRVDARLDRDGADRPHFEPQRRQRRTCARALQRNRAAGFGPLRTRRLLQGWIVADPRRDLLHLLADGLVDQRLDLRGNVDARARHRKRGVAEIDLRGEVWLEVPGRGQFWPRRDGDAALDLGVSVEFLDVDAADLLGGLVAEQAAERVADRAGR